MALGTYMHAATLAELIVHAPVQSRHVQSQMTNPTRLRCYVLPNCTTSSGIGWADTLLYPTGQNDRRQTIIYTSATTLCLSDHDELSNAMACVTSCLLMAPTSIKPLAQF